MAFVASMTTFYDLTDGFFFVELLVVLFGRFMGFFPLTRGIECGIIRDATPPFTWFFVNSRRR